MGFSLNKVQLIGNIGRDSETRYTTSGAGVTTFSVATVHSYKGKDEQWVNTTTWHNITAWGLSDYMKEQLQKGKKVYVEGRISIEEYKDKDGNDRKSFKIIAENIIPLESNGNGNSGNSGYSSNSNSGQSNRSQSNVDESEDLPF